MRSTEVITRVLLLTAIFVGVSSSVLAQVLGQNSMTAGPPAGVMPAMLKGITIQQKLNTQIPLDLHFRDEDGRDVSLGEYFTNRPVILNLAYFQCAMLCPQVVEGLAHSLKQLTFQIGQQYTVLTVSFDPRDTPSTAAEKRHVALAQLGASAHGDGWHFLTGDQASILRLTDSVGFVYRWDPTTHQFFHAAGIMVLTPEGKLSRYFYGLDFNAVDLRLGLVEASHDRIGSAVDAVLLFCCRYDAVAGTYEWLVGRMLAVAGALTIVILATFLVRLARSEPQHPRSG